MTGFDIGLGEPRNFDVSGDYAYVAAPVTFDYDRQGKQVHQTDAAFTVVHRKADAHGGFTAWFWTKGFTTIR